MGKFPPTWYPLINKGKKKHGLGARTRKGERGYIEKEEKKGSTEQKKKRKRVTKAITYLFSATRVPFFELNARAYSSIQSSSSLDCNSV